MTLLESVFAGVPGLGVAVVQVTLVGLLGFLAWFAVRCGGPALRGAVLLATLVALLVVPGLAAVAPVWLPLPEFAWLAGAGQEPADLRDAAPALPLSPVAGFAALAVFPAEPLDNQPSRLGEPMDPFDELLRSPESAQLIFALPPSPGGAMPPARTGETPRRLWTPSGVLATVWLCGALACLTRAGAHLALLYWWARQARPVHDREWTTCLKSLAEPSGRPAVVLRESPAVASPLTLGLLRPMILLPTGRRNWSAEQPALILAHELAHVRRHDFLAGLVAELAACLCWFHPLVRWLAGRLRLEQEYTADAWAVSVANNAQNYVRCLARLALELGQERGSLAPAFWRRRPEILRRIDMLRRNPHGHPHQLRARTVWTVAALAAAACLTVAGVGPLRSAAMNPPPAAAAPEVTAPATVDQHGDPLPTGALARLGTTRWRHGANVTFVAFGADGKTLFTAGQDNTVRLWDLATGQEIRRFGRSKPAEPGTPPSPTPVSRVQVEARTLELNLAMERLKATQAQLDATLRQTAKPAESKAPPARQPGAAPAPKGQPDAKAAQLQAELAAKKAQLEVQAAQLATMRGNVNAFVATVAPDGKTLALASANVIQVYDVETGKEIRQIDGRTVGLAGLVGLLFSPDSRTLATRAADGAVIVWEAVTGNEIRRINAPSPPGNLRLVQANALRGGSGPPGMAFAPDGKTLAIATTELKEQRLTSSVKIWDVATGKEAGPIKASDGQTVSALAFTPNGKVLACAGGDNIVLCEPDTGKELRVISALDGVVSMVFSPDGKVLAFRTRNDQVRLCETETGKELARLGAAAPPSAPSGVILASPLGVAPEVRNLAFSPDGKQIATASGGTIRLWDSATGKEVALTDSHQGALAAVALSTDGKTVVSWGADRMIRRWEAATGKPLGSFQLPPEATMAVFSPDGRSVALAKAGNRIQLLDTVTGQEQHSLAGPTSGTSALAFAPDGKVLAARGGDNAISLFDLVHGGELRPMAAPTANNPAPGGVVVVNSLGRAAGGARAGLVFSPDGKVLASTGIGSVIPGTRNTRTTTDLYDVATGKLIRKLESSQPAVSFAFSPDGRVLATENADQSITLWEVASGKEKSQLSKAAANAPSTTATGVFAVASDRRIVSADAAGPITLAFAPDGRALVARGPDLAVRVWDVAAGKEVSQLKGHEGRVETIAFAPDGQTIATGGADTTILLWDAAAVMKDVSKPALAELPDGMLERLWGDLAGEDASKAYQSILTLAGTPKQAVPFLAERLKPAASVDLQLVERWVADLENARYAVRQEASANLAKAGEQVVPSLQKVLASQPTIETRKRVEDLLDKLTGGTLTSEQLQLVRAVEALEKMGTPEARQLLQTLAGGAAGALPTRQAQEALSRLPKG